MRQATKLDKAKVAIGLDHPFFASILYKRKLVPRKDIPTLAVSDRGTIYYNEEFIESLPVQQIVWGLAHEVGHVINQTATRRGTRDHKKWNYATDAWINDTLDDCNVGQRIPNTIDLKGSKDKTSEQIYGELPDQPPSGNGQGGQGGQGGGEYMDGDGMGEDIIIEGSPMTESEIAEAEGQMKVDLAEAAQVAKMRGKLPGKLAEFVNDRINSKIPWYEHCEKYMTALTASEYTWTRPNRRHIGAGVYMPSTGKVPTMGELAIIQDISGSISAQEIAHSNGHLSRLIEQCKPERVHVLYVDTHVQKYEVFEQDEDFQLRFHSGGGTDMVEGFNYMEQNGINPELTIVFTDGYTPFPDRLSHPAIWCISSDVVAPSEAGETVHFEMG